MSVHVCGKATPLQVRRQCCRLGVLAGGACGLAPDLLPLIIARAYHVHSMCIGRRPPPATRHRTAGRRCWRHRGRAMPGPCTPRRTCEVNHTNSTRWRAVGPRPAAFRPRCGEAGRRGGGEAGRQGCGTARRAARRDASGAGSRRAGRCLGLLFTGLRTASSRRTDGG